jgi:hypothetical protein
VKNTARTYNQIEVRRLVFVFAWSIALHCLTGALLHLWIKNSNQVAVAKTLSISFQGKAKSVLDAPKSRTRKVQQESSGTALNNQNHTPINYPPPSQATESYVDPNEVDTVAHVLIAPELPLPTDEEIANGTIKTKLYINSLGVAVNSEIETSSLPTNYTNQLATTLMRSVFQPAVRDGKAVNSWLIIEITLEDSTEILPKAH